MDPRAEVEEQAGHRWVVMGTWLACLVTGWMIVGTIGILLPSISEELDLSPGEQGLLGSIAVWGNLGLAIPMSWWVSRYSPTLVSTVTQIIATICVALQAWSPTFAVLLVARLGLGTSLIAREPSRALLTQQWFSEGEIPMVNAISNAVFTFVIGAGLVVTPFILSAMGDSWRGTMYAYGGLFAVLTVLWIILGKDRVTAEYRRREAPREAGLVRGALGYRDLWLGGLGFFGCVMAETAFLAFFPTMMLDTYDMPLRWSGMLMFLWLIGGGIAGFGINYLATNLGWGKRVLQGCGLLMVVTYIAITHTGSLAALVPLSILNGVAWGTWPLLMTIPFRLPGIRPREVAMAISFIMMMISGGSAVGPLIAGFLQEALNDLRLSLFIISFGGMTISLAGVFLRPEVITATREAPSRVRLG